MKKKKIVYNFLVGILGQIITILLGLILPKFFITSFGSEVNGLVASVTQIYVYVNLLEAGVGTATLQALYKPIALNDKDEVNSILSATSIYYKKTGILYFLAVIFLSIIFPLVFKTNIDKLTIFLVVLFSGLSGVINYFFQGKYRILLEAEGKNYILMSLSTIITIVISIVKIILIVNGYDVVVVQLSFFIINLIQVFVIGYIIQKDYKWIDLKVKPNFESISQKKSVLVHQVSFMIFSNTDILILTMFTNFKVVSVYALYNQFFKAVAQLLSIANNSATFALGQLYNKSKSRFIEMIDCNEFLFFVASFSCYTTLFICLIPFMEIYTVGFTDINYIDVNLAILFLLIEVCKVAKPVMNTVVTVAGHFKQTSSRAIIEMMINLITSLIGVYYYGIYGVLIGTILALLYRSNDFIIYANKTIMERTPFKTYKRLLLNIVLMVVVIMISNNFVILFNGYLDFFIKGLIMFVLISFIYISFNSVVFVDDVKGIAKLVGTRIKKNN